MEKGFVSPVLSLTITVPASSHSPVAAVVAAIVAKAVTMAVTGHDGSGSCGCR